MGYETEAWRSPSEDKDETVLFSEHGRILHNTCYRAYWFKIVRGGHFGKSYLIVKHGGGQERIALGYRFELLQPAFEAMDSDTRFLMMFEIFTVQGEQAREAAAQQAHYYQRAFLEGRLKKRRKNNRIRCEVLPEIVQKIIA